MADVPQKSYLRAIGIPVPDKDKLPRLYFMLNAATGGVYIFMPAAWDELTLWGKEQFPGQSFRQDNELHCKQVFDQADTMSDQSSVIFATPAQFQDASRAFAGLAVAGPWNNNWF
jgi:hypothetical protein